MNQLDLAETGFLPKTGKQTRKALLLAEMETVVSRSCLEVLIEPFYPKKGNGRPPMPLSTVLQIHFIPQDRLRRSGDGGGIARCSPVR